MMAQPLLLFDTYQQLIQTAVDLFNQNTGWTVDNVQLIIKNKLLVAKELCLANSATDIIMAEFAACAFIDAYALSQKGVEKNAWRKNLLQDEYFNTTDAGVIFFEKAEALTVLQPDLLHLYFYCLASGFSGRYYAFDARDALQKTMENLLLKIDQTHEKDSLANQGLLVGEAPLTALSKHKLSFYSWILAPLIFLFVVYGSFYFSLLFDVQSYLAVAS